MAEWWRSILIRAIDFALGAILFAALELSGFFRVIFPSGFLSEPALHYLAMVFVAMFLQHRVRMWLSQRIFKPYYRAWNLAAQDAYPEAAAAYREQIDFLEKNPWVELLRTPLLMDVYQETLTERMWIYLSSVYSRQGDEAQAIDCLEKSVEISPGNFNGLYALSIIAARMGQPPRPFSIPREQIEYGGGILSFIILWLMVNTCGTILANVMFFFMDGWEVFAPSLWTSTILILALIVFLNIPATPLGWLINQVVQAGYHSAYRMAAAGDFDEAARALERDVRYWRDHAELQKLQRFLFDTTRRSYLERSLRLQAVLAIRMGKPDVFVSAYREVLAINPESDVRSWLKLYEDARPET